MAAKNIKATGNASGKNRTHSRRSSSNNWKGSSTDRSIGSSALLFLALGIVLLAWLFESNIFGTRNERTNDSAAQTIRLSEVVSSNTSTYLTDSGDALDWIEVCNASSEPIDIGNYSLFLSSSVSNMYVFPGQVLAPGEYAVVFAGKSSDQNAAPFGLPASGDDTLVLANAAGAVIDSVALPELDRNSAYVRTDGNEWAVSSAATPGRDNIVSAEKHVKETAVTPEIISGSAEITEVMTGNTLYLPSSDGKCNDYVEILNTSGSVLDLSGWYLSDSASNLKKWSFPETEVRPGARIVIICAGAADVDNAYGTVCSFALSKTGCRIYLTRPDGKTVSHVSVPALQTNQAYSLIGNEWTTDLAPTPGYDNTAANAAQVNSARFGNSAVTITEIMASPTDVQYDWLELYNSSNQPVDISGWGISNDASKPRRYQFPDGTILQPGEYKCIVCSGTDASEISNYTNASITLSVNGGYTVSLCDPNGQIVDAVYVPQQYSGLSYSRTAGSYDWSFYESGTLGSACSGTGYAGKASIAECSVEGGLYKTGETVTVTLSSDEGGQIYYTTDSSDPTTSSTLYTGPITISSTTILRTRVYVPDYMESYIDTHSYLFDVNTQEGVYVISLVSDRHNLTDPSYGIMVSGDGTKPNYQQDWEREASIELFTGDSRRVLGAQCGISLHGADSRELPIKSFNVIARSQYGCSRFEYPIFSERDYTSYKSILLRPSGEDWGMSFMRDTVLSSLMKDSSLMYQKWELGICYLNGQYHTLYYIRERITPDSICQFEGWEGMEDEIDVVRGNVTATHGSNSSYESLLEYIRANDTSDDAVFARVEAEIDVQNFIEYMAIEIFSGNTDLLNVRRYRNASADGKWRWALFDLDWAFFQDVDSISGWLDPQGTGIRHSTDTTLFIACMNNAGFRDRFLTYFGEMLATAFSASNVIARIDERTELLEPLLPDYLAKWNIKSLPTGIEKLKAYAKERPVKLITTYFPKALKMSDADIQKYFGRAIEVNSSYAQ